MSDLKSQIEAAEQRWHATEQQRLECRDEICKHQAGEQADPRRIDDKARIVRRLERLNEFEAAETLMNETGPPAFDPFERIIKANQLKGIDFFERGLHAARAVSRIQIRGQNGMMLGHGSGVLISPRLLMTNNHVLGTPAEAAASTAQFDYLVAADGIPREPQNFAMDPDTFFVTDAALDFTIVALAETASSGQPLSARSWCALIPGSGKALVSERVNIIQHPGGERMQIAIRENTIVAVVDDFLHYETDTKRGSSGSPVFNDQWEMAALHHAGVPKRDASGRILMDGNIPWTGRRDDAHKIIWIANEGVRISRIVSFVNQHALSAAQSALWQGALQPPPLSSIWDLFQGYQTLQDRTEDKPGNLGPAPTPVGDGHASWLFRLSFGQVADHAQSINIPAPLEPHPQTLPIAPAPSSPVEQPQPPIQIAAKAAPPKPALAAATRMLEQFAHTGPYYDAAEDTAAANSYWQDIDWTAPAQTLFDDLTQVLERSHTTHLSYRRARHEFLYPAIDLHPDGTLHNVYSGTPFDPVAAIAAEMDLAFELATAEGFELSQSDPARLLESDDIWDMLEERASLPYNCEHVVPQSWFDKRQPMKADIHHLFACEPGCNSFRSNIPYWQFDPTDEAERDLCGRRQGNKFEPEHSKGAVARASFYFLARYPGEVGDKRTELTKSRLPHLLEWHTRFPVGEYERHRNWLTQKAQGNRNPFIDHPEVATTQLLKLGFGTR